MTDTQHEDNIGVVVIGRNESRRLRRCLEAVCTRASHVVYVDSGSTDGSSDIAEAIGVSVIHLDGGPYTAARGRQLGFEALLQQVPHLEFVQFVDGDCILHPCWIDTGLAHLRTHIDVAAVFGRRREEYFDKSFYSRLIDIDWDHPVGAAGFFTGDGLVRVKAMWEVGGWSTELIAGEDPDLCIRMRDKGWKIIRLPSEMSLHDVAITRFTQYWRRTVRSGHAYAEVGSRHPRKAGWPWLRIMLSILAYGVVLPGCGVGLVILYWPVAPLVLLIYLRLIASMTWRCRRKGWPLKVSLAYASMTTLGKFAGALGVARYVVGRLCGQRIKLIEYKSPETSDVHKI